MPDFYWVWLIEAAALGLMGDKERAAKALAKLIALMPGFSARDELYKWSTGLDDSDQILAGLKKAGYSEQGSD
ncbi:MAG: hypothetical protein ACYST9_05865 [Planctomycetota bacterium]|jgi:hypothetical protein